METAQLVALVDRLCAEPNEVEWFEFKVNRYDPQEIGEYLSALANSACLAGKQNGYLVFGIGDRTHEIVGTHFDPHTTKGRGNQDLLIWLGVGLQPNVGFEVYVFEHHGKRVVLFEVGSAWDRPVRFYGTAYVRVGESRTKLSKYPEKERAIWVSRTDWSAQRCERVSLGDLDPNAIQKARLEYKEKFKAKAAEVDAWDDITFLNKAKVTIQGEITNTTIILLGKPESASLLAPAVARISWILKDGKNNELDYEHFGPPFILNVDQVLARIRNLKFRAMPSGTLFPVEIYQYDPWVIREALHNCIAHQDYGLRGRVNVVETPSELILSNMGRFIPGSVARVIHQDAPLEIYRNPFLTEAMVNLNMIDTQGGGIKRMYRLQMERFFPLPDYDLSDPERVVVALQGTVLDERYTRLLMERTDLDLWIVILLDKVQKHIPISREDHGQLKEMGLVEGRYPNIFIAGRLAKITGQKARHIRERGFDKKYYIDLIVELIKEHQPVSRNDIDRLLLDKLPDIYAPKQKRAKIHNLLSELSHKKVIINTGTRRYPKWVIADSYRSDHLTNKKPG